MKKMYEPANPLTVPQMLEAYSTAQLQQFLREALIRANHTLIPPVIDQLMSRGREDCMIPVICHHAAFDVRHAATIVLANRIRTSTRMFNQHLAIGLFATALEYWIWQYAEGLTDDPIFLVDNDFCQPLRLTLALREKKITRTHDRLSDYVKKNGVRYRYGDDQRRIDEVSVRCFKTVCLLDEKFSDTRLEAIEDALSTFGHYLEQPDIE